MKQEVRVASRESQLAVVQSRSLMAFIEETHPDVTTTLVTLKTTGDKILDRTLDKVGGKGLFVKELDIALRENRADISVHSLKDVPMEVAEDLPLLAFSRREDPRDVLVLPKGATELDPGLPIGSSSLRRQLQLAALFPEHRVEPVRGNLQTRLRKLDEGQFGGLILAAAGLRRLGLADRILRYFSPEEMIPAGGQGILAVQGRAGEEHPYLEGYEDHDTALAAICERGFVTELDGGCSSPVAAHAEVAGGHILLRGLYWNEETHEHRTGVMEEAIESRQEAEDLGRKLADKLRKEG